MKKLFAITATLLAIILMFTACSHNKTSSDTETTTQQSTDMFTDRDLETEYDESIAQKITVSESNSDIKITAGGTYILSGSTSDGSVTVDVPDTDKVQLVLNGVSITSKTSSALYVKSADKVFVTTVKGTENTLSNGGSFTSSDESKIDGAVFSKSDIVFNGEGTLNIKSPSAHGIVGKDDVKFTSGTYNIECASHGIDANDSIRITNSTINITSGKDGMHCENKDTEEKGYIYIESGTFEIKSGDDGIHANTYLTVDGGTFNITAAEGLEATCIKINDGTIYIEASDDGINAAKKSSVATPTVEIGGGKITIVMGKGDTDGIDSNGDIIINGGTVDVTGNSSFDYDGKGVINGGTVIVNGSEVTTLPNQFMGGGMPGGMNGKPGEMAPNDATTSATPDANGTPEMRNGNSENRPSPGEFDNSNRPKKPSKNTSETADNI